MAAVLACGSDAALSHTSAAALWGMLPVRRELTAGSNRGSDSRAGPVHITVPGNARSRAGITVHRSCTLFPSAVTRRAGIPVTAPSRTLADLRRILPKPRFAAALREAEFLGLPIDPTLEPDRTRGELEARFLASADGTAFQHPT
jgi:hypothetical protein